MYLHSKQSKSTQGGFGLVGILLVILVIAMIAGVGTYIYHQDHKSKVVTNSSATTSPNTKSSKSTKSTATTPNPYVGWKTYCDTTTNGYCFKYPATWTLSTSNPGGVSASLNNPGNTVLVSYSNPESKDNSTSNFYTADIESVRSNANLKVIGGTYPSNYLPTYFVIDSSLLNTYPLAVGQTSPLDFVSYFTTSTSSKAQLYAIPVGTSATFSDLADAESWFSTSTAKTVLLIEDSLYSN
jgi:Tfp pilus assembly major pilin PilA